MRRFLLCLSLFFLSPYALTAATVDQYGHDAIDGLDALAVWQHIEPWQTTDDLGVILARTVTAGKLAYVLSHAGAVRVNRTANEFSTALHDAGPAFRSRATRFVALPGRGHTRKPGKREAAPTIYKLSAPPAIIGLMSMFLLPLLHAKPPARRNAKRYARF